MITQSAITDPYGNSHLQANVNYSVRARVQRTSNLSAGTFRITAYSPSLAQIGVGLAITALQATMSYQEFTAQLFPTQTSLPSDLLLRVYADGTPGPSGEGHRHPFFFFAVLVSSTTLLLLFPTLTVPKFTELRGMGDHGRHFRRWSCS